jgi:molecular chaperone DnaK (HSP70)
MVGGIRLGVDLGTSNTVAVLRWPDGRCRPLLFDGSPQLPSAVYAGPEGMLVGRDAVTNARVHPDRFERNPKRRIDDGTVLLGDVELPVVDLMGAVLRQVYGEAVRVAGGPVRDVVLTHPVEWGPRRRAMLAHAAGRAGLGTPRLVPEPVAAASYFVAVLRSELPVGRSLVVYDFGAGTFDATVVRRTADSLEVLATDGVADAGGLDIDAAVVTYLGEVLAARDEAAWQRLVGPRTSADRRLSQQLWDDVRGAKEMLSRAASTVLHVPLLDADAPVGREQLERFARPVLDRTIAATQSALAAAGVAADGLAGVFLVGGSSRIPLVATLLHRTLRVAPTTLEQPEIVVAEGSLFAPPAALAVADLRAYAPPNPRRRPPDRHRRSGRKRRHRYRRPAGGCRCGRWSSPCRPVPGTLSPPTATERSSSPQAAGCCFSAAPSGCRRSSPSGPSRASPARITGPRSPTTFARTN